jgi:transportin-1
LHITQKLNNFTRAPDYIAYLAYILTAMPEQEERIRTIAGYLLKNNARLILSASAQVAMYVKASVLQAFTDTSIMIRNAAGQDIVAFLGALEPKNWPECLQQLVTLLDSSELDRQEVSHFYFASRALYGSADEARHDREAAILELGGLMPEIG